MHLSILRETLETAVKPKYCSIAWERSRHDVKTSKGMGDRAVLLFIQPWVGYGYATMEFISTQTIKCFNIYCLWSGCWLAGQTRLRSWERHGSIDNQTENLAR